MWCLAIALVLWLSDPAPRWTLPIDPPEGLAEIGAEIPGDDDSHRRVELTWRNDIAPADLYGMAEHWRAAAQSRGFHVVDRFEDGNSAVSTVARCESGSPTCLLELRVLLVVDLPTAGRRQARGFVEARNVQRPGFAPPGECLPVPRRAWRWWVHSRGIDRHGRELTGSVEHVRASYPAADVDGDLRVDWLVPSGGDGAMCPDDLRWEVWVTGADISRCAHRVGAIGPGALSPEAWRSPFVAGLRVLSTVRREVRAEHGTADGRQTFLTHETHTARFDGTGYRVAIGPKTSGLCHHCATWTCSPPEAIPSGLPR